MILLPGHHTKAKVSLNDGEWIPMILVEWEFEVAINLKYIKKTKFLKKVK